MEKYIVNYETALKLKEIGFIDRCLCGYTEQRHLINYESRRREDTDLWAPLYDQVLEWFRNKGYQSDVNCNDITFNQWTVIISIKEKGSFVVGNDYNSYEEARQKGIDWIINKMKNGSAN